MNKHIFIIVLILFIFWFPWRNATGQNVYQTVLYTENMINATSQPKGSFGYRILLTLAQDNVKNLSHVYLDINGKVLLRNDETAKGHTVVYLKFVTEKLDGETRYRDFNIDTLLIPSAFKGVLSITQKNGKVVDYPLEMLLTGGIVDMGSIEPAINAEGQLEATIRIDRFIYSRSVYEAFMKAADLINNYYAYNEILNRLLKKYQKAGINRGHETSQLFVAWHEIMRIYSYIESYHFKENLLLKEYDPANFLAKCEKLKRLGRRATTLRKMVLQSGKSTQLSEKEQFALKYTGLSATYSNLSGQYQPYIATGFGQVVRIFPGYEDMEAIAEEAVFYDVFENLDQPSTPQLIYNYFIDLASYTYRNGRYVSALDFIYNAKVIEDYFKEIKRTPEFEELYMKTLDGVLRSYLEVAIIAYRRGSYTMADRYYRKAEEAYDYYQSLQYGSRMPTDAFLMFIEEQVELSYGLLKSSQYYKAVAILDKASEISSSKNINTDSVAFDSAYSIGYRGIYGLKLDSLSMKIQNGNARNALSELDDVYDFSMSHNHYIKGNGNRKFLEMAEFFYKIYYDQGLKLMNSPRNDDALQALLEAQTIRDKYLHREEPELDSLIDSATVPVILDLAKKASFEVWANRIEEAEQMYSDLLAMQNRYHQQDNPEINEAVHNLREKIDNRNCVTAANRCFALSKQVENRIRHNNFDEAKQLLDLAYGVIRNNPGCRINQSKFDLYRKKYKTVFTYLGIKKTARNSLDSGDYSRAVKQYIRLEKYYSENNLKNYNLQPVLLDDVVKSVALPAFTDAVCKYFIKQKNYKQAFYYLSVLKEQNVPSKNVKDLQVLLGSLLAQNDSTLNDNPKARVREYTGGEKWYRYFRLAYMQY
ncbi:MAG: hypothetical protein GXO86_03485 [Chlorobi bacterium]|nr:hypothetical protein [Chlorobiota bacterium]